MKNLVFRHNVGDSEILFVEDNGIIGLVFVPSDMMEKVDLSSEENIDGMIQLSVIGDTRFAYFSSGKSMRNSSTSNSFRLKKQRVIKRNDDKIIETTFTGDYGIVVKNFIEFKNGKKYIKTYNEIKNKGTEDVCVEMTSSFNLSGISPFRGKEPNMKIYRMFGNWSAEGRPECRKIETAGLEKSWSNYGLRSEKFGAVGSMPIQKYFPFVCLEDCDNNIFWGVLMEAPCSWQMEVSRYNRYISISGGYADYEYGHLREVLKSNEKITTSCAYITTCSGNVDDVYNRLRCNENNVCKNAKELSLPIIYNEYCDSWGNPTHCKVIETARKAKALGADYFVIDAGWYCSGPNEWSRCVGDFAVNANAFPYGIAETTSIIREIGLVPGIWFEFECVSIHTELFKTNKDMFLKKDGKIIVAGNRAFLDFRKTKVRNHLRKTVIEFLKNNGFGYIKVDYNECLGIGCDGAESLGLGLKNHIDGVISFFKEIRKQIPEIIIEVCASGGHRLEPKFLSLADMASFSDAHEGYEGAVVAANVNKLCPTRKNQIWAVINNKYSLSDIRYSIAKTFFGRMCLSGDINNLTEDRNLLVKKFVSLYKKITHILQSDENYYFGETDLKYMDLKGEQAVLKVSTDGNNAIIIAHGFNDAKEISVFKKGLSDFSIEDVICSDNATIKRNGDKISIYTGEFDSCVVYLKKH